MSMVVGDNVRAVRHLKTHYQLIRQMYGKQKVNLFYVQSDNNIADVFTKVISNKVLFGKLTACILSPSEVSSDGNPSNDAEGSDGGRLRGEC